MNAPMRLAYRRTWITSGLLTVQCYIPSCARSVATFGISDVRFPSPQTDSKRKVAKKAVKTCDLCGDNDPRSFRTMAVNSDHDFTAPFRLELHRAPDGSRSLHVFCYVEECNRAFAVLGLVDEGLGVVDGGKRQ
jgi:hypothetical protein